jgi:hypothetical protein
MRIIDRLIQRTANDSVVWQRAAPPQSWAVDIGQTRFRIYPAQPADERRVYVLDVMGPVGDSITSDEGEAGPRLESLYRVASENGTRHTPDPLLEVESELGLADV